MYLLDNIKQQIPVCQSVYVIAMVHVYLYVHIINTSSYLEYWISLHNGLKFNLNNK